MPLDGDLWPGRRVLLTGHTGFKGAWLALVLQRLGAEVFGLSSGRFRTPSLYDIARIGEGMAGERALDVRDAEALRTAVSELRPEVVLHLAAQPLVRRSLLDPIGTYEVNVLGTVNLLDAVRRSPNPPAAVVIVTSAHPFAEGTPPAAADPYSSSKACVELVADAYRRSFFAQTDAPRIATARAGNVIGGGDWGVDRLLPDAVRVATGQAPAPLRVRNPSALRPWQHVLNPLSGYLLLAQRLIADPTAASAWDFGPPETQVRSVGWLLDRLSQLWDSAPPWRVDDASHPPERPRLELDCTRAVELLGWRTVWDVDRGLRELVSWLEAHSDGRDMREVSAAQVESFMEDWRRSGSGVVEPATAQQPAAQTEGFAPAGGN